MHRRLIAVIGFELYALSLAAFQQHVGVRTDEAKYLLDIAYPHPPAARWVFSLLDGWAGQELFWRIVLATLLVQAVWLVGSLLRDAPRVQRGAAMAAWALCAGVAFQAGTVMMAPLTALQGMVFLWLLLRGRDNTAVAGLIALFWLFSLFTAYQIVLYAPLVAAVFHRTDVRWWKKGVFFLVPVGLLALYTLTNPMVAASMVTHAGKDAAQTLLERAADTGGIWLLGGSGALSIAGTIGLLIRPRWGLVLSFLLVLAYVFVSRYDYYAVLFTPLFIAGLVRLLRTLPHMALPVAALVPAGTVALLWFYPSPAPSAVPETVAMIAAHGGEGELLIAGSFGHSWQHASPWPVRRYHSRFLVDARAVVCLVPCEEMASQPRWVRAEGAPFETWLKERL